MNLLEKLISDHHRIREQFEMFRNCCEMDYGERQPSATACLKKLTRQFRDMILLEHLRREEERLFPQLEKIGVSVEQGPIGMLLAEHRAIRECFRNLETFFEKIENDKPVFLDLFCHQLAELAWLFELHSEKEERGVFQIAEQYLCLNRPVVKPKATTSVSRQTHSASNLSLCLCGECFS